MKVYTVARTVVFYFEVEGADSPAEALAEVEGLGIGAAVDQDEIRVEVCDVREIA
jgi:hypothetical protein